MAGGISGRGRGLFLSLLLGVWPESAAHAQELPPDAPFAVETLRAPGRALEAWPIRLDAGARERALLVVAVEGSPPDEVKRLCVFTRGTDGAFAPEPGTVIELDPDVVAFDVAAPAAGAADAVVVLAAEELRVVSPHAPREPRRIALEPPAPLLPRGRELARLPFVADWQGDGAPRALVPELDGARLVPLGPGAPARLRLPVRAEYETRGIGQRIRDEFLYAELRWPALERGDEDGDGRPDLFVLSRFGVDVHRLGPEGLSERATHTLPMRPFTAEEELRPRATSLRLFAPDLDGDGRADVVVHRTAGSLMRSRSLTEVFLNPGAGIASLASPSFSLAESDGLVTVEPQDLDGDGHQELVTGRLAFGVVQVARILATRRATVDLLVIPVSAAAPGAPKPSFERTLSMRLDFAAGRVVGLLPTADGDWNGDGRRDLVYGAGADEIVVRLGSAEPLGPGFGGEEVRQDAPSEGLGRVADLDGDGLPELVLVDPQDAQGRVRVLRNRGRLPGTPASLRSAGP